MSLILSFDVGIINLAYCLFTKKDNKLIILDWNLINLSEKEINKCHCGKNASCSFNNQYYCKVHVKKCEALETFENIYKSLNNSIEIDENISIIKTNNDKCCVLTKDKQCNKKASFTNNNINYCTTHAKSEYKKLQNLHKMKLVKNKSGIMDFDDTRLKLFQKLNEKTHLLKADIILIENQPSMRNPTMKSISTGIYDFYLMRGLLDKVPESNIKKIKFMSPSNKLKLVDDGETKKIVTLKNNNDDSKAYKLTKALSVKYAQEMINTMPEWKEFLSKQKKKDDLADALLQGCYYYEKELNKN